MKVRSAVFICFRFLYTLAFLFSGLIAFSQSTPNCGVKASFGPFYGDTVLPQNSILSLTNTSTNATSSHWLINGFYALSGVDWSYVVGTGIQNISLVATNGACSDTSETLYILSPGTAHSVDTVMIANYGFVDTHESGTTIDDSPDGGFIMGGYGIQYNQEHRGLVVKITEQGCIEWTRQIKNWSNDVDYVYAAPDTTYYVSMQGNLIRLNRKGDVLWNKGWSPEKNPYKVSVRKMVSDSKGYLYAQADGPENGCTIFKMDKEGTILWKRYLRYGYSPTNYMRTNGMVIINDILYISGHAYTTFPNFFSFLCQVNTQTGQTQWQYGYRNAGDLLFLSASTYDNMVMVSSNHSGKAGINFIDAQGNFKKGIKVELQSGYGSGMVRAEADKNGKIVMYQFWKEPLPLQPYYSNYSFLMKFDTSLTKYWGMQYSNWYRGFLNDMALNKNGAVGAVGEDFGKVADAIVSSRDFKFMKIDSMLPKFECDYRMDAFSLSNYSAQRFDFNWATDSIWNLLPVAPTNIAIDEMYFSNRYTCPDFIDSCSHLKISGPKSGCSFNEVYTYTFHKNKKCALIPSWQLPAGVQLVNQTDSTVSLRFPDFGTYKIAALIKGCTPVKDSLTLTIKSKTAPLNLGRDTSLCPNSTIRLSASNKFLSYRWQNNSADSFFVATDPGLYWVEVIDSCGNTLRDSILISAYSLSINAGPDRIKCNSDTLHLRAPDGFISYSWSNNYNISSLASQQVVVNPTTDTAYYLKAEKLPGCFAYDTLHIKVYYSPAINLGNDVQFCIGDSVSFNAGTGFTNYNWSNGATTQQVTFKQAGTVTIKAVTQEGCTSADTVTIRPLWPLPVIRMDHNPELCIESSRTLDPGAFRTYLWQDGSTGRTFEVNGLGRYFVLVSDDHHCRASDTVAITTLLPVPSRFLPNDTLICSYGTLTLKPLKSYSSYQWSTGSLSSSLSIDKPGLYWLQVQDNKNCTGRDSTLVNPKECMKGTYIPSAFTPNNDGNNDVFKAKVFGPLKRFELTVYNRWGTVVFHTKDPEKGWDGLVKGQRPDSGIFIWQCRYQLENEPEKMEKGTVTLIR
ncbi:gliding motility-associated C-terminal domain-containing protein [Flavisolibacter tropicus]|uniref:Gliding motility-associated C-terminal domain-containing protein n=1 Tax=Flavisolibacter tropicus TaxID=1492898 RepID=A0A172TW51_9BACT|nr:gliding motility-associated C-terminal domain-containing protein [Flavisolibacter tropicus]ANE51305.1 hypothetical protein SY85_13075 [Flavisolibacter tropicus]